MSNVPTFDLLIASPLWRLTPNGDIILQCLWLSGELVSTLACHPEYKLLSVCSIPQMPSASIAYSTFSWPGLLKHLRQMLISNTKMEEGKSCQNQIRALWFIMKITCFDVLNVDSCYIWHHETLLRILVVCPVSGIDWQVRPLAGSERSRSLTGPGFNTSLANLLVLRGKDVYSAETGQTDGWNVWILLLKNKLSK